MLLVLHIDTFCENGSVINKYGCCTIKYYTVKVIIILVDVRSLYT